MQKLANYTVPKATQVSFFTDLFNMLGVINIFTAVIYNTFLKATAFFTITMHSFAYN